MLTSSIILNEMQKASDAWSKFDSYYGSGETSNIVSLVVDCICSLNGTNFFNVLPTPKRGEWEVKATIKKHEQEYVLTLSVGQVPKETAPQGTDFDARIYAYWNDVGVRRLEISFPPDGSIDPVVDALTKLAMKTKLAAP